MANQLRAHTVDVGGLHVVAFDSLSAAAIAVVRLVDEGSGGTIVAVNAEKVIAARKSPTVRTQLESARLLFPDGAGVVVAMRLKGIGSVRVPGADLWLEVLRQCAPGARIAVIGASPEVLSRATNQLLGDFPTLDFVLARDGYGGVADLDGLVEALVAADPKIVFMALGSPKQEAMMEKLGVYLDGAIFMGLGGSLDVYTGTKRRAPLWMQRAGLEWLYRLFREPSRVFRQRNLLVFFFLLVTGRL